MKKSGILIGLMCFSLVVWGQHSKPNASFKESLFDFGTIQEEKGKVEHVFKFTNIGGQPLVIHNVATSCGCTSPEWTKLPVPPGGNGTIKVTFDPSNRPGPFNKTITVSSNAENESVILRITGTVSPKPLTLEQTYPKDMSGLRLKSSNISFTRIFANSVKVDTLEFINNSKNPIKIGFQNVPAHIELTAVPQSVAPGKKGFIRARFDASKIQDFGFVNDIAFVLINDKVDYTNQRITITANIEEDFSKYTPEQLASAPVASFDNQVFEFGDLKQGESVTHNYILKNAGKSELIIRKIKASCGCTAVQPQKMVLAPGESTEINTVFNSAGKSGKQIKTVTVITNDPKNPTVMLRISGNVVASK